MDWRLRSRRPPAALSWMLLVGLLCASPASAAEIAVVSSNIGEDRWIGTRDPIEIEFDRLPSDEEGRLALIVGGLDVSALLLRRGNTLRYEPRVEPLHSGEQSVEVYLLGPDGGWTELATLPMQVTTRFGFRSSNYDARVDLSFEAQVHEDRTRDAGPSDDERYARLDGTVGLETHHETRDFDFDSRWDLIGTTETEEALRFDERGFKAPPVDLAEYLVSADYQDGKAEVWLGHGTIGEHRHLMSAFGHRGVGAVVRPHDRLQVAGGAVSARPIVGGANFSGLAESNDLIGAVEVGVQLLDREWVQASVTTTLLQGQRTSEENFNAGQVVDREESRGAGLHVDVQAFDGRIRVAGGWSRSVFDNPSDADLFGGFQVVDVERDTDDAHYADVEIDLVRDVRFGEEDRFGFDLTAFASHEQVDPLYRSIAAFSFADNRDNAVGARAQLAGIPVELSHSWNRNNLDDVAGILVTRTRSWSLFTSIPVADLLFPELDFESWQRALIPVLEYTMGRVRQKGEDPDPTVFTSVSHNPEQVNWNHSLGAVWSQGDWALRYGYDHSNQDNRQTGRRVDDFIRDAHVVAFDIEAFEWLTVGWGFDYAEQFSRADRLRQETWSANGRVEWRPLEGWLASVDASFTLNEESTGIVESEGNTLNVLLSKAFDFAIPKIGDTSGRIFARYQRTSNDFDDRDFGIRSRARIWTVVIGSGWSLL